MSNVATLTLKGTSDLKTIATDLKSIATESKATGTGLKGVTTELDKGTKSAGTFGQKMKSFGSTFSSSIASIGTLGGTVLNLSRQYQDLGDSQIRVDKSLLKVSRTTEATKTAQGKLNDLLKKGVTSGAEYEKALLDVKQAQEAQTLATTMLGEAQEDQQRAQENFWIGLIPTVTSAGASVMAVIKDLMGTKGFGGLKTAVEGATAAIGVGGGGGGKGGGGGFLGSLAAFARFGGGAAGAAGAGAIAGIGGMFVAGQLQQNIPGAPSFAQQNQAYQLAFLNKLGASRDQIMGVRGAMEQLNSIFGLTTATVAQVDAALGTFNTTTPKTETGINRLATSTDKWVNAFVKVGNDPTKMAAFNKMFQESGQSVERYKQIISEAAILNNTFTQSQQKVASSFTTSAAAAKEHAIASLQLQKVFTTMVTPLTYLEFTLESSSQKVKDFVANTQASIKSDIEYRSGLMQVIKTLNAHATAANQVAFSVKDSTAMIILEAQAALGDKNAMDQLTKAKQADTRATLENTRAMGVKVKGFKPGSVHAKGTARYVTSVGGKITGYGPGVAPPTMGPGHLNPVGKHAAHGMHETLNQPTWILAGESGKERVDIDRPGKGGGGGTTVVNVYVDGVLKDSRYRISQNQGSFK
jgi:hypothetical protein